MGYIYMIRQGLKSIREKPQDTELEDKIKKCCVLYNRGPWHNKEW